MGFGNTAAGSWFRRWFDGNPFLILAVLWIVLWLLPWADWLAAWPWVRMGVGIMIFAAPGMALSLLLVDRRLSLPAHFNSGLVLSIFCVGLLGFLGRLFQLPFAFIRPVFAVIGLVALLLLMKASRSGRALYKPHGFSLPALILFLAIGALCVVTELGHRFALDDFSYLAYLTSWQHAPALDFHEVVFGSGAIDSIRFWSAMFPMCQAFLAEISGLHGLLMTGVYLGPFFIIIALLAGYHLYEDLFQSDFQAVSALLLQVTFLFLLQEFQQPGNMFFYRIGEDKVFAAFAIFPVFFIAVRYFLESFTLRAGLFVLLTGFGLALTHPIVLAYAIFIVGVYAGLVALASKEYKKLAITLVLLLAIIAPSASLRFIRVPSAPAMDIFTLQSALSTSSMGTRISYIKGTPFYGFDLNKIRIEMNAPGPLYRLRLALSWSFLAALGLGFLWSVFNLKKKPLAPFVAATSLLVLLCAIPYTGWLVGYFVSARMLWRAPWFLQVGLIGVILLSEVFGLLAGRLSIKMPAAFSAAQISSALLSLACLAIIAAWATQVSHWQTPAEFGSYVDTLSRLAALGDHLENDINQPARFAAGSREMMSYLPGLSSKSKTVFFRDFNYTRYPVDLDETALLFSGDPSVSLQERVGVLDKYHIGYLLLEDPSLGDYYAGNPQLFSVKPAGDGYAVAQFLQAVP